MSWTAAVHHSNIVGLADMTNEGHAVVETEGNARNIAEEVGHKLQAARQAGERSTRAVATDLKLTTTAVGYLESGQWDRLGPSVYVRGYLRAYARLVDVDLGDVESHFAIQEKAAGAETLAAMAASAPPPGWRRYHRFASYALGTALLAVPALLVLIRAFDGSLFVSEPATADPRPATSQEAREADGEPPVIASMTGISTRRQESARPAEPLNLTPADPLLEPAALNAPQAVSGDDDAGTRLLELRLTEEAWIDIRDARGERLLFGLQPAGSEHAIDATGGLEARVGNADGVDARLGGELFDLRPHTKRDIADFSLDAHEPDSG